MAARTCRRACGSIWAIRAATGRAIRWWSKPTNFTNRAAYRNANGETLTIVERFTPIDSNTVEWLVTLTDPATWPRPWAFGMHLTKKSDAERPFEYACHEGNYGLQNILSAARAEERTIADAARRGLAGPAPSEFPREAEGEERQRSGR